MMGSTDYGYEYYSGANVVLEIEGQAILECAGISTNIAESKKPVYGYSSRHFDAVARGQVLGQGSMLINYVFHDYLYHAIALGLRRGSGTGINPITQAADLRDQLKNEDETASLVNKYLNDPESAGLVPEALKQAYYTDYQVNSTNPKIPNPHDSWGGMDIKITFGERSEANFFSGKTGMILNDVYFVGRGQQITVSEDVILEEYTFFYGDVQSFSVPYRKVSVPVVTQDAEGRNIIELENQLSNVPIGTYTPVERSLPSAASAPPRFNRYE